MTFLWLLNISAQSALAARIIRTGTWRDSPALISFLLYSVMRDLTGFMVGLNHPLFGALYVGSVVVTIISASFLALEVFQKRAEDYPGIESFLKILLAGVLTTSLVVTSFTLYTDISSLSDPGYKYLVGASIIQRYFISALAIGLLLTAAFFKRYPTNHSIESLVMSRYLTTWFSVMAISYWIYLVSHEQLREFANVFLLGSEAACVGFWALTVERFRKNYRVKGDQREVDQVEARLEGWLDHGEDALTRVKNQH